MSDWQPEHFSSGRDVVQLAERMRSEFDVEIMDHDIEWMNAVRDPDKDDIFVLTRRARAFGGNLK